MLFLFNRLVQEKSVQDVGVHLHSGHGFEEWGLHEVQVGASGATDEHYLVLKGVF